MNGAAPVGSGHAPMGAAGPRGIQPYRAHHKGVGNPKFFLGGGSQLLGGDVGGGQHPAGVGAHPWVLQDLAQGQALGGVVAQQAGDEVPGALGDAGGEVQVHLGGGEKRHQGRHPKNWGTLKACVGGERG